MKKQEVWCTKEALKEAVKKEDVLAVDIRPYFVYAGWTVSERSPGGHIPGTWDRNVLSEKERISDSAVLILCGDDEQELLENLREIKAHRSGETRLFHLKDWLSQENYAWEKYPHYERYVPPVIVNNLLQNHFPEEIPPGRDVKVFHIGWGDENASLYTRGHIPGSRYINSDTFEPPRVYVGAVEEWRLASEAELTDLLQENEITEDTIVISTGRDLSAACRFAWICTYMGIPQVYVMTGGIKQWKKEGFPLEKGSTQKPDAKICAGSDAIYPIRRDLLVSLAEMRSLVASYTETAPYEIVDIREWAEFTGRDTGYAYHHYAGAVPHAKFGGMLPEEGGTAAYAMQAFRYRNQDMRNPMKIRQLWKERGISGTKQLIFYCGSGWRAAEVWWDCLIMGIERAALFSDGWISWSNTLHE